MTRSLKKNPFVANHLLRKINKIMVYLKNIIRKLNKCIEDKNGRKYKIEN